MPATPFQLIADIPYLGEDRAEKMDAYLPAEGFARPLPAVLLIHGGGWRIGDKADNREKNIASQLVAAGFAVFSINYLLNRGTLVDGTLQLESVAWPQNLHDCKSALRFLRRQAGLYGLDPRRIGVMGGSAGGTFALMLGATSGHAALNAGGLYGEEANDVACVVDFYGPPDVRGRRARLFSMGSPEEQEAAAQLASPVTHLTAAMPPVLICHGTADALVPISDSRQLAARLEELGVDYWYVEIAGAPHTFHLQPEQMDLSPIVIQFLTRHLALRE